MHSPPSIVITQREGFSRSRESLLSVLTHTPKPYELIYVDGASPPEVRDELRRLSEERGFRLLRHERYLSPNEAREAALPFVSGEYTAFLDNDVLVAEGWLEGLLTCAAETGAGVVAPLYLELLEGVERLHMFGGHCRIVESAGDRMLEVTHDGRKGQARQSFTRIQTEHIEMHGFIIRTALLSSLRVFDPEIPTIPENADFCLTVLQAGETLWIEPRATVTVVLPTEVPEPDRGFYRMRWSDGWIDSGFTRFREKWGLSGFQPVLDSQRRWAVAHRMVSHEDALHRRLGIPSDSILNRWVLAPLERAMRGW
jgi:glycosyltransferase involved in cell wall biosynthesis